MTPPPPPPTTPSPPSPLPAVVALGAVCQIGQILLLRELLMVFHGSELSIGLILAAWMAWVGVGSRLGVGLVERSPRPRNLLVLAAAGVLVVLPASLLAIRALRGVFDVLPGATLSLADMVVSCVVVTGPVGLLLGAQFVVLARLWRERDRAADTGGAAKAYIGEAAGMTIGGVLFTLVLVRHANPFELAVLAGTTLLAAALWLLWRSPSASGRRPARTRTAFLVLLVACASTLPFLERLDAWAYRLQWRALAPDHTLVAIHPSKYGTIAVARRADQVSVFQSGHLVFSAAAPEAEAPGLEEQEAAVFAHVALAQHPDPKSVLLIGGGLRGTLREILRHPVARVDYVELDPALVAAARPHLPAATLAALEDPRVRLRHTDGRLFVKRAGAAYDLIVIDAPDPATAVLNRVYTEAFFREARARLNPGGVLVTGATSTPDLRGPAAHRNAALYHTLKRVFAHVLPAGERFLFLFASDEEGQVSADPEVLRARFLARGVTAEGFSHREFDMLLEEGPLRRVNWVLRHHGRRPGAHREAPEPGPLFPGTIAEIEAEEAGWPPVEERAFVNADFRPIGVYHTLVFRDQLTRAEATPALAWIARVEPWWIVPVVAVALVVALVLRAFAGRRGRHPGSRADVRFAVMVAVVTTGLSTMALEIALLLAFQAVYGFVFEVVGLIVAVFMAGLLLGTLIAHRWVKEKANLRLLAAVQLALAVFAGLMAWALPASAALAAPGAVFALFLAITAVAGLLNGVDFPLTTACWLALSGRPERAAGTVYGVELFGACAGAALAGAVVAPVLGLAACCLLAAIANATAFGVILIARRTTA